MLDWFISYLIHLNEIHHRHCSLVSIAIRNKRLKDDTPQRYKYDDVLALMRSLGYAESHTDRQWLFYVDPCNYRLFCNSVANPKRGETLLNLHYEKDPNEETKYYQSGGCKIVSVLKVCQYLSGETEKKRVFVPLKDMNNYL